MFSKNWKRILQSWQRYSGTVREGSRASRRKNRQSSPNRVAFHLSPRIESLEQRTLLSVWPIEFPSTSAPIPKNAQAGDTSSYALGTMTWNIIFVSTTDTMPDAEVWTEEEMNDVKSVVASSAAFWEAQTEDFVPGAQLKITTKYLTDYGFTQDDVAVDALVVADAVMTPGDIPLQPDKQGWISEAMSWVHLQIPGEGETSYFSTDNGTNVNNFNNDTRYLNGTNWSGTIFFVHDAIDNLNDPFPNTPGSIDYKWKGRFPEYAYAGGGSSVITQSMAGAITHEVGHLMGALDEYLKSGAKYSDFGGYLWYQNFNCEAEPAYTRRLPLNELNWPDTLYLYGSSYISPPVKHHLGLWDTDHDHIPDILDTLPTATGSTTGSNSSTGTLNVSGQFDVTELPNMSGGTAHTGITICTIASAYYRLNGGEEVFITPDDGVFDGYSETYTISIDGLLKGNYTIDIYAINSVGNVTAPVHLTFTSTLTGPDLVISKSHTGNFTQGQPNAFYSIIVTNSGTDGSTTSGLVTVIDTLPAGFSAVSMTGAGWTVDLSNPSKPKAMRSDPLTKNSSYPTLTLVVSVARDVTILAPYVVTNKAVVSGGSEVNTRNDTALDSTTVLPSADLIITKFHTGIFTQGDKGDTYTIVVTNASPGITLGTVTVVDTLPAGLHATAMSGNGWTVNLATLTATRSDTLAGTSSYPPLIVTVDVDIFAPAKVTNVAMVSGGLEATTTNNTARDETDIERFLAAAVTNSGSLPAGTASMAITFNKPISAAIAGDVTNYELRNCGYDGILGNGDDVIIPLSATYFSQTVTLQFPGLSESVYRLKLHNTIVPDGDWTTDFVVVPGNNLLAPATTFSSGGLNPLGIAKGDFNSDGKLDLVVANSGSNSVQILLGLGSYAFTAGNSYPSGYQNTSATAVPVALLVNDYNGDGKLDFAVANYDTANQTGTVQIFLGNGDGTFALKLNPNAPDPSSYTWADCSPQSLATADFNGDGKLDLTVANYNSGKVTILSGNGDGTFAFVSNYISGGANPRAIVVGDFNSDGKPDIAVANEDNSTVGVFLNSNNGVFPASAVTYLSGGTHPRDLAVGDFNNDQKLDIVTANFGTIGGNDGGVGLLLNRGNGSFPPDNIPYFSGGSHPSSIAVADFDYDGNVDVAVTNSESGTVSVLLTHTDSLGHSDGFFYPATTYGTWQLYGPGNLVVGDFNSDGKPDVAVTNTNSSGSSNTVEILGSVFGMTPDFETTPYTLSTPNHYAFDISTSFYGPGEFIQGTSNAFDGLGRLMVDGALFQPTPPPSQTPAYSLADDGQTLITLPGTAAGLIVNRRITVPSTGDEDFARTVDSFTNPTAQSITTTVSIVSNLGADADTAILATSSGDLILTPDDQWFVTGGGYSTTLLHYVHGPRGLKPTSVSIVNGDNIVWTYNLTVDAGQTRELAYFTIQAGSAAQAIGEANALVGPTGFSALAKLGLSTTDLAQLANFSYGTIVVLSSDWAGLGMTLTLGGDGLAHLYQTGTTTDIFVPCPLTDITNLSITGRNFMADKLTVDFSNGNPIPVGGVTFDGGAGTANSLLLVGGAGNDSVTMAANNITDNGSMPITYSNVSKFGFALGTGANSLLLDHVTFNILENNAISTGTKVTVDGGTLNYNGHVDPIGNLTIKNGGHVIASSINNTTTTVSSGTLTVGSIVCDTLNIGGSSAAAAGSPQSPTPAVPTSETSLDAAITEAAAISETEATDADATANASSAAIAALPVASNDSELSQISSVPSIIANPQISISAVTALSIMDSAAVPAGEQSKSPIPISFASSSTVTLDSGFGILGMHRISDREQSVMPQSMSLLPSVILAEMQPESYMHAIAAPDTSMLQNRLRDTIFERISEKHSIDNSAVETPADTLDLERIVTSRPAAKNHRHVALALESLFSE